MSGLKIFILFFFILFTNFSLAAVPEKEALLSFNFQKISIRDLISILAKYSHANIILSSQISNQEISLHLEQVTWQQALTTVLGSQSLSERQIGDTLIIAPINDINQQIQQQFLLQQQQNELAPLTAKVIHLRYAKAQEIAAMLKENNNHLLSSRGNVAVDLRTNSLWLEDTPTQFSQLKILIDQLDNPAQQVSIEARVVTLDSNYEKELGVRFGLSGGNHLSGTLAGANQLANHVNPAAVSLKDRLNFDFSASPTGGNAGTMGLALAKLADGYMLDLELSALQAEGAGEIIAKPSLVTANQQAATIQTGEEIPYQEKTSSGATNVAFKKAVLSLEVTPQVTADNRILLTLHISQDKPSSKLVNGVPAIETREIQTQVLVNNNQTLVLGGIYEETEDSQQERIPFFGDLPIIGKLFQHHHDEKEKRELLIFVRPAILDGEKNDGLKA
jgi:type IV pilus assembly protein PilQ